MSMKFKQGDVVSFKMLHSTGLNDYAVIEKWQHGIVVEAAHGVVSVTTVLNGTDVLMELSPQNTYEYKGQE
jgi:hypothetical protein